MKTVPKNVLVQELAKLQQRKGNAPLEQRMYELALWYSYHMGEIPMDNLAAKCAFLEKAFWIQVEINALMIDRINSMKGSKNLWLPSGISDGKQLYA